MTQHYTRIKDLREDHDLTQKQVAEHMFIQLTQYRRYESGEREAPAHFIKQLAYFYNISADYILGITNEPTPLPAKKKKP